MSKFKVGDHLVVTRDDWFKKGTHIEVVGVDTGCTSMPYCCFDGEKSLWIGASSLALADERPKFEVGQIYRVGETSESGNIIKITKNEPYQLRPFCYETIRGAEKTSSRFGENSRFANSLTLLTGPQIGEAIRKYDADHAEKKTGVKKVKRDAEVGEWVKVLTGDGHHAPVGGIFKVIKLENWKGWVRVFLSDSDSSTLRAEQYVVLEGYKPKQKEEHRKAKVGDTIKIVRGDHLSCAAHIGAIGKVVSVNEKSADAKFPPYTEEHHVPYSILHGDYEIVSSGKHSYTDAEIAEAKKLCGEMMVEAFDDGKTFAIKFYDKFNGGYRGNCAENEVEVQQITFGHSNTEATATCSDHDEYNVWIGRCVALCKALHKPIPAFIMGDGKIGHFDFEKAKAKGTSKDGTMVVIHFKDGTERDEALKAIEEMGIKWHGGEKPTEWKAFSDNFLVIKDHTFFHDQPWGESNYVEFSDCFTED